MVNEVTTFNEALGKLGQPVSSGQAANASRVAVLGRGKSTR
ncbi:hypothetical protein BURPS406E_K0251 [Burkholderia pseudomallei 406e]|nr:hypothetical protein BURPS406E_K0251 [Burkholderia pseudomallei 406e]